MASASPTSRAPSSRLLRRLSSIPRSRVLGALALASALGASAPGCDAGGPYEHDEEEELGTAELPACDFGPGVKGLDVSYYQGSVNWTAVAGDGWEWAIARVSHSTEFIDPEFQTNWQRIKEAGMIRGAYQYFEPNEDPVAQAQVMIDAVGVLGDGDLPAVIDVEEGGATSKASYIANIQTWVDLVEEATGKKPMIYTGSYFWDDNITTSQFNDHVLWLAHYTTNCPRVPVSWEGDWGIWQYTSTGPVPGIPGNVDKNWFKGTKADLAALAAAPTGDYAAALVEVDLPATVLAGEAFDVTVRYANTGTATWDGSTSLGTTQPRDRPSDFADASWPSDHRAAVVTGTVAPDGEHSFTFTMRAPDAPGAYVEAFGLVQEGVTWFADAGGPADDAVRMTIQVVDPGGIGAGSGGDGGGAGAGGDDDGASAAAGLFGEGGGDLADGDGDTAANDLEGDSCAVGGTGPGAETTPARGGLGLAGALAALMFGRAARRRRR